MILDYTKTPFSSECESHFGATVFVDGLKIERVFYVDTVSGVVRSYDVRGDAQVLHRCQISNDEFKQFIAAGVKVNPQGLLYRIHTGKVTIKRASASLLQ